jgi:hypothetical protein
VCQVSKRWRVCVWNLIVYNIFGAHHVWRREVVASGPPREQEIPTLPFSATSYNIKEWVNYLMSYALNKYMAWEESSRAHLNIAGVINMYAYTLARAHTHTHMTRAVFYIKVSSSKFSSARHICASQRRLCMKQKNNMQPWNMDVCSLKYYFYYLRAHPFTSLGSDESTFVSLQMHSQIIKKLLHF